MIFTKRTKAPTSELAEDKKYYFTTTNPYYPNYGMPNCTSYVVSRMLEIGALNNTPTNKILDPTNETYPNGESWGHNKAIGWNWKRGQSPKLGAVGVWAVGQVGNGRDGAGHVAIVEEILSDNETVVFSNSGWVSSSSIGDETSSKWWWLKTCKPSKFAKGYTFQYYLYPPYIDDITPPTPPDPPDPPDLPQGVDFNYTRKKGFNWCLVTRKRKYHL